MPSDFAFNGSDNILGEFSLSETLRRAGIDGSGDQGHVSREAELLKENEELRTKNSDLMRRCKQLEKAVKALCERLHREAGAAEPNSTAGTSVSTLPASPFDSVIAKLKRDLQLFQETGLDNVSGLRYEDNVSVILDLADYPGLEGTWTSNKFKPQDEANKSERTRCKSTADGSKGKNGPARISQDINDTHLYITGKDGQPVSGTLIGTMRKDARELFYEMGARVRLPQTFGELPLTVRMFTFRYLCHHFPVLRLCYRNWKAQRLSESAYSCMILTYQTRYDKGQGLAEAEKNGSEEERAAKRARIECASPAPTDARANSVVPETPSHISSSSSPSLDGIERPASTTEASLAASSIDTNEQPTSASEELSSTFSADADRQSSSATEESQSDFPSDINQPPSSWRFQRRRLADNYINLSESINLLPSTQLAPVDTTDGPSTPITGTSSSPAAPLSASSPETPSERAADSEAPNVQPAKRSDVSEQPTETSAIVASTVEMPAAEEIKVHTSTGQGGAPMAPLAESCTMHMYYANWPLKGKGTKYALSRDFKKLSEEEKLVYEKKYKEAKEMKVVPGKRKRNTT
ncbi:hypothetical protein CONPUDRAFT_157907 [Coniophora puteana RWD-64-598 SS2]|uniref:Uncharacterized protein n=1 Tax=Coniophora puteana (strain RWD-64-598) TaxID=741705 RepID=A0A5M3MCX0_CONPW|nr:uncharacterized protein CONPUDRAFT_157907 [Coniophora puteana RWD-64-598 SS2]EIW76734.1 hypothetical protein CONPUDRAFT_157907 [Coniophora puteana RWD-64-598 SS2]